MYSHDYFFSGAPPSIIDLLPSESNFCNSRRLINVPIVPAGRLIKVKRIQSFQGTLHSLKSKSHWNVPTKKRKVSSQQFGNTLLGKIRNNYTPSDISEQFTLTVCHFSVVSQAHTCHVGANCSSPWILLLCRTWLKKLNCKGLSTFTVLISIVWLILLLGTGIIWPIVQCPYWQILSTKTTKTKIITCQVILVHTAVDIVSGTGLK